MYTIFIYKFFFTLITRIRYKIHISASNKITSRIGSWYCPTRQVVNAWLFQHQSLIPSRKFIRMSRERYITWDSQRCLLEAFTAFRLSIKDKVSLFRPWSHAHRRNADANSPRLVTKYRLYSTMGKKSRKSAQKLLLKNATKWFSLKSRRKCMEEDIFNKIIYTNSFIRLKYLYLHIIPNARDTY